ncbi:uncharacterized protein BXZ73DRAFT_105147 [Epithele typhae]|uniref:uncharacterized protein n=1 Tax=Epithele typhae TaxID=378194 RepID=UPI0020088B91|nr:uncharacterized protein BXZ73DRAFT_105147 [Epithele typhae]KAH9918751.1 hypothetical protein BXZ73DRAFT_105147 [Epithele typhae]
MMLQISSDDDAKKYLDVLLLPHFEVYNNPHWVSRIVDRVLPPHVREFYTTHSMFAAMYATADLLELKSGRIYVSATICRCAAEAAEHPEHEREERLATALEKQATTWMAHMLWPFAVQAYMDIERYRYRHQTWTPTTPKTAADEARYKAHRFRESILARDSYKCCFTGFIHKCAPEVVLKDATRTITVEVARIFRHEVATSHQGSTDAQKSLDITLKVLGDYCEIADSLHTIVNDTDDPQNAFSLGLEPQDDFNDFSWCLKATETPDRYEVCYMSDNERYRGYRSIHTHITFVDHSTEFSTSSDGRQDVPGTPKRLLRAVPNPELLRMHCALAHVMHLSGATKLFRALCISWGKTQYRSGAAAHIAPTGAAFMAHVVDEDPFLMMELRASLTAALSPP